MINEIKYDSREEWLKLRRGYIGGSDAGAVMGLNPYSSPYAVWAEKTGRVEGFTGNLTTKVGSYLEDFVALMFSDKTGKKCWRWNRMLVNDEYPWACADVDRRIVREKAILEIKTTNSYPVMKKLRTGEYPEQWYCQMVHYLAVTGMERAYLAVLINCRDLHIYTLDRDQAEIDALMDAERDFWALVQSDTPPEADGSQATSEALRAAYPGSDGSDICLYDLDPAMEERANLVQTRKRLDEDIDRIDNLIKAKMQSAERADFSGYTVTWKNQDRKTFDKKALAKDYPMIDVERYSKTATSRVFRVAEKKDHKEDKAS